MDKGICSKERIRKNNLGKGLNETEVSNSPDKEFKIIVIRCLLNLEEWRNIVSTSMKRQQTKKEKQSDLKNTITSMKNTPEGNNSRLGGAEQISDLEDRLSPHRNSKKEKDIRKMRSTGFRPMGFNSCSTQAQ